MLYNRPAGYRGCAHYGGDGKLITAAPPGTAPLETTSLASTVQIPNGMLTFNDGMFAAPGALVLLQNGFTAAIPLTVSVTPAGTDVAFQVVEDPADSTGGPVPAITKTGSNTATRSSGGNGSFEVLAYIDTNSNGTRDNDEGGAMLPLVLVSATLNGNSSAGHSGNISPSTDGTNFAVGTGNFVVAGSGGGAGMYLGAKVDLVGGGANGQRGVDRVFAGWIQDIPVPLAVVGSYAGGHTANWVFASNVPVSGTFLPTSPAPAIVPTPLLDTGRSPASVGGDTAALSHSHITSRTGLASGQGICSLRRYSPGLSLPLNNPGFPGNALQTYQFNLDFRAYLCLWTNANASSGASGNAADTSYANILESCGRYGLPIPLVPPARGQPSVLRQ